MAIELNSEKQIRQTNVSLNRATKGWHGKPLATPLPTPTLTICCALVI